MTDKEAFEVLDVGIDTSKLSISGDAEYAAKFFEAITTHLQTNSRK